MSASSEEFNKMTKKPCTSADETEPKQELIDSTLDCCNIDIDRWRQQTLDDELLGIKSSCLVLLFQLFLSQCQNLDGRPINTSVKFEAYLANLKPHHRMIFD